MKFLSSVLMALCFCSVFSEVAEAGRIRDWLQGRSRLVRGGRVVGSGGCAGGSCQVR